ncbi:MAG TPA: Ig-like domain-containing protein, partial [Terriglobales bacterium]|nr:Ig-like domain-containing protein [Terriglobales bacterium]
MPDQPRHQRSGRSPVLLILCLLGAVALAAMLAGDAFGSAGSGSGDDGSGEAAGALNRSAAGQPAASGQLAVQYTFPAQHDAEVDAQANVLVQFNRPVAPITALAQRSSQPVLAFDPPVNGAGHWLTSSLYVFRPDALQPNAHYSVRVLQRLSDLPDGQLPQEYVFDFATVVPAVADTAPRDNTQYIAPAAPLQVLFNQSVEQATAESLFSLSDGTNMVTGAFSWPDDHTLVFQPAAPLARGVRYTASAAGAASPAKAMTWSFTTAEYPRVKSS